ncbi:uncharacterized protein LOC107273881 isoform X2 [Cephus cinctus]|uniref:Uncharacterized protein LOC107273881 isoform X2 n=1 Tax=Cephus cinctus TaxID=211228 RepID=A0AAJ7FTU0_CEPCN|nr:uncharacterized protein LOC107273881 isoform X2 [Cephus cinctus]
MRLQNIQVREKCKAAPFQLGLDLKRANLLSTARPPIRTGMDYTQQPPPQSSPSDTTSKTPSKRGSLSGMLCSGSRQLNGALGTSPGVIQKINYVEVPFICHPSHNPFWIGVYCHVEDQRRGPLPWRETFCDRWDNTMRPSYSVNRG